MTSNPEFDAAEPRSEATFPLLVQIGIFGFVSIVSAGGALGATIALVQSEVTARRGVIVALFLGFTVASGFWLWKLVQRWPRPGIEARNVGTARRMTIASGVIGGLLGLSLPLIGLLGGGDLDPMAAFTDTPLPPWFALAVIAALCLVVPVSLIWHRSIDEHESNAYRFGALLAVNAYFFLSSIWWFAARGGFVSAPDGMAIFFVTVTTWGLGWVWARFR